MIKRIAVMAGAFLLLVLITAQKEIRSVRVATSDPLDSYYHYALTLGEILQSGTGLGFHLQETQGDLENLRRITSKKADLAFVKSNLLSAAYHGEAPFPEKSKTGVSAMAALYSEACQVIARPDSALNTISDLKGKVVAVGENESATEMIARQILSTYGLSFDEIQKQNLTLQESVDAYRSGTIDAFFMLHYVPDQTATAYLDAYTLIGLDEEQIGRLTRENSILFPYTIPGGSYPAIEDDVRTVALKVTLAVRETLPESVVYQITKALFENKHFLTMALPKAAQFDAWEAVRYPGAPLHPGAEAYYKEMGVIE